MSNLHIIYQNVLWQGRGLNIHKSRFRVISWLGLTRKDKNISYNSRRHQDHKVGFIDNFRCNDIESASGKTHEKKPIPIHKHVSDFIVFWLMLITTQNIFASLHAQSKTCTVLRCSTVWMLFKLSLVSIENVFINTDDHSRIFLKGLFTLTAATTTATATEEWVTLDPMEVFTWRPAAKATSTHRVQYNLFFPLPLPQSVWTIGSRCSRDPNRVRNCNWYLNRHVLDAACVSYFE